MHIFITYLSIYILISITNNMSFRKKRKKRATRRRRLLRLQKEESYGFEILHVVLSYQKKMIETFFFSFFFSERHIISDAYYDINR